MRARVAHEDGAVKVVVSGSKLVRVQPKYSLEGIFSSTGMEE